MAIFCPSILARDEYEYKRQIEKVKGFTSRFQIDLTDGIFAQNQTVKINQVWLPQEVDCDLHLMYTDPTVILDSVINLRPNLVIVHAESEGNFFDIQTMLHTQNIKVGVCLLPQTQVAVIEPIINIIDHILIFSGNLGNFGGQADMSLINKVKDIRALRSDIEIGWDGGVNDENCLQLSSAGVDVLNVGGYLQNNSNPQEAYNKLTMALREVTL